MRRMALGASAAGGMRITPVSRAVGDAAGFVGRRIRGAAGLLAPVRPDLRSFS